MSNSTVGTVDRFATTTRPVVRLRKVAVGLVRIALAVQFGVGGTTKLLGEAQMVAMFDDIGAGQWFRLLIGVLEIAGAIGLLVPRLAGPAATGLVALMAGAAFTNVVVLGTAPVLPLAFGVLAAVVALSRRKA